LVWGIQRSTNSSEKKKENSKKRKNGSDGEKKDARRAQGLQIVAGGMNSNVPRKEAQKGGFQRLLREPSKSLGGKNSPMKKDQSWGEEKGKKEIVKRKKRNKNPRKILMQRKNLGIGHRTQWKKFGEKRN